MGEKKDSTSNEEGGGSRGKGDAIIKNLKSLRFALTA